MMNVPKLRFKGFLDEWKNACIIDVANYVDYRGKTPVKTEQGIFLVTAKNIKKGYIDYASSQEFVSIEDYKKTMSRGLPKIGDVLITTEAPLGNVATVDNENIALAQRVIKYRGKEKLLNNYYFKQLLLTDLYQKTLYEKASGGTVKGIKGSVLHKIKINHPTLLEQEKIASFFTAVDSRLEKLKKKKELLEQYKKGIMQKIFSQELRFKDENGNNFPDWDCAHLNDYVKIYDGTHQTPNYVSKGIPFYSVEHITSNNFSKTKFIEESVYERENLRVKLEKGDILMTRIGDIGTSKLIDWDVTASFYVSLALFKSSEKINSAYLNQYIKTKEFQNEIWKRTIHVAFPKKINLGEIGECSIKVPTLNEQQKIADFLTALDKKIDLVNQQITKTELWKKGLLQKMFV